LLSFLTITTENTQFCNIYISLLFVAHHTERSYLLVEGLWTRSI